MRDNTSRIRVKTSGASNEIVQNNYDKLDNVPITNLRGRTKFNFINLAGLTPGRYHLIGYYKYTNDPDEEVKDTQDNTLDIHVFGTDCDEYIIVEYLEFYKFCNYIRKIIYNKGIILENSMISLEDKVIWKSI